MAGAYKGDRIGVRLDPKTKSRLSILAERVGMPTTRLICDMVMVQVSLDLGGDVTSLAAFSEMPAGGNVAVTFPEGAAVQIGKAAKKHGLGRGAYMRAAIALSLKQGGHDIVKELPIELSLVDFAMVELASKRKRTDPADYIARAALAKAKQDLK